MYLLLLIYEYCRLMAKQFNVFLCSKFTFYLFCFWCVCFETLLFRRQGQCNIKSSRSYSRMCQYFQVVYKIILYNVR